MCSSDLLVQPSRAQQFGRARAEDEQDRVGDVALARAVGAGDAGEAGAEGDGNVAFEGFKVLELKFEKLQSESLQVCLARFSLQCCELAPDTRTVVLPIRFPESADEPAAVAAVACY